MKKLFWCSLVILILNSCNQQTPASEPPTITISREAYQDKLYGFWLGQCIANWTGLVTEMDKIGNIGEIKTGDFYTREDWGQPDQPNIWSQEPSELSPTIDFVLSKIGNPWGADDDTDIEYIYQHLLYTHQTSLLTGNQIRDGWLKHIKSEEENYLWVSNQRAFDLMKEGVVPPATGDPENNEHYDMIDAQLTTEIFGLFAPTKPQIALKMANIPIRTTARENAAMISEFYVYMHALASIPQEGGTLGNRLRDMARKASQVLGENTYSSYMYNYVLAKYESGISWEQARDSIYVRYQVEQQDGYRMTDQNIYCNGCFAAGINFAASLISLFYGDGDIRETIKIGSLCGWDSDNPTATWGGLIGFMIGKEGVEKAFGSDLSNEFNIHRTRQRFPGAGIDTFEHMAQTGIKIVDRVVVEEMAGEIDKRQNAWVIPMREI